MKKQAYNQKDAMIAFLIEQIEEWADGRTVEGYLCPLASDCEFKCPNHKCESDPDVYNSKQIYKCYLLWAKQNATRKFWDSHIKIINGEF